MFTPVEELHRYEALVISSVASKYANRLYEHENNSALQLLNNSMTPR